MGKNNITLNSLISFMRFHGIYRWLSRFRCTGRLLDVGCGRGELVEYLRNRKWEAYGIDPVLPFDFAGGPLLKCDMKNTPFLKHGFDVIIFNFSLEHMENPEESLGYAYRLLNHKRLIFIRVPNYGKIYKRRFWDSFQIRISSHQKFFNPHSLKILLERNRFRIIQISTPLSTNAAITIPCSLFSQLDPEQWIHGNFRLLYLAKTILLSILSIIFLPITWLQCQIGYGPIIYAVAEKVE